MFRTADLDMAAKCERHILKALILMVLLIVWFLLLLAPNKGKVSEEVTK